MSTLFSAIRRPLILDHLFVNTLRLDRGSTDAAPIQQNGNEEESIAYLERLVSVNHKYQDAGFLLGFAYQQSGDNQRAISEYKRFLEIQPEHVQARFNFAFALMKEGECNTAIEDFDKVLALRPQYQESHLHLSRCYRSLGKEALAEKHEMKYKEKG